MLIGLSVIHPVDKNKQSIKENMFIIVQVPASKVIVAPSSLFYCIKHIAFCQGKRVSAKAYCVTRSHALAT